MTTQRILIIDDSEAFAKVIIGFCRENGFEYKWISASNLFDGKGMPRKQYVERYGDDFSMGSALCQRIYGKEAFGSRKFLDENGAVQGKFRSIAAAIDDAICEFKPTVATINNGFPPLAQIGLSKCMRHRVRPVFLEAPIMPGAALMADTTAPFFVPGANGIDRTWSSSSSHLTPEEKGAAEEFHTRWLRERKTKIPVRQSEQEMLRLQEFLNSGTGPIAVLALQVLRDMSIAFSLPSKYDGQYTDWVQEIVKGMPEHWRLIIKKHPRSWHAPSFSQANVILVDAIDIHSLIDTASCVITLCSNVGLEAAMRGKPAIIGGRPFYAQKGITLDLDSRNPRALEEALESSQTFHVDKDKLLAVIYRSLLQYQIWPGQSHKFLSLVREATTSDLGIFADNRRPFYEMLSADRQTYIDFFDAYQMENRHLLSHRKTISALIWQDRFKKLSATLTWRYQISSALQRAWRKFTNSTRKRIPSLRSNH